MVAQGPRRRSACLDQLGEQARKGWTRALTKPSKVRRQGEQSTEPSRRSQTVTPRRFREASTRCRTWMQWARGGGSCLLAFCVDFALRSEREAAHSPGRRTA